MSREGALGETEVSSIVRRRSWIWFWTCWPCTLCQGRRWSGSGMYSWAQERGLDSREHEAADRGVKRGTQSILGEQCCARRSMLLAGWEE